MIKNKIQRQIKCALTRLLLALQKKLQNNDYGNLKYKNIYNWTTENNTKIKTKFLLYKRSGM